MRIDTNKIPPEGLIQEEEMSPADLELGQETVDLAGPVKVRAQISKVSDVVIADLSLKADFRLRCSRCLEDFTVPLDREFKLDYTVDKSLPVVDFDPQIREEIIMDYPLKPLCRPDCKGLCLKCGRNLNEGSCDCKIK